jgi:DHA1 family inner membrane transport protein
VKEEGTSDRGLSGQVALATLARLVLNIAHRMVYPFLPAIARGLGVSMSSASTLVTVRSATGLASPLFGPLSDRLGRRRMMALGLLCLTCGAVAVALVPAYAAVMVGFVFLGLSKTIFDPSLQAWVGDSVPYERRGTVMAITELAWAGAILVGAPAVGQVIDLWGWRTPFLGLAVLGAAGAVALLLLLPRNRRSREDNPVLNTFAGSLRTVLLQPVAAIALVVSFLVMLANECLFITYGAWMEDGFGLSVARLGLVTMVVGAAEMLGELGVVACIDRIGKRRGAAIGMALTATCYLLLPWLSADLRWALAGLSLLFLFFEFTVVSLLPLATELVPVARGTMMALNIAAMSLGRSAGALLGTAIWSAGGMVWTGVVAGLVTLLSLLLLLAFVREGHSSMDLTA